MYIVRVRSLKRIRVRVTGPPAEKTYFTRVRGSSGQMLGVGAVLAQIRQSSVVWTCPSKGSSDSMAVRRRRGG